MDLRGASSAWSGIFTVSGSRLHLDLTMGCKNLDFCAMEKLSTFTMGMMLGYQTLRLLLQTELSIQRKLCSIVHKAFVRGSPLLLCINPAKSSFCLLACVCWAGCATARGRRTKLMVLAGHELVLQTITCHSCLTRQQSGGVMLGLVKDQSTNLGQTDTDQRV